MYINIPNKTKTKVTDSKHTQAILCGQLKDSMSVPRGALRKDFPKFLRQLE